MTRCETIRKKERREAKRVPRDSEGEEEGKRSKRTGLEASTRICSGKRGMDVRMNDGIDAITQWET